MAWHRGPRVAPLLLAALLSAGTAVAAVTFSDGTFANASWSTTVVRQTGSASHFVVGQIDSQGSPGASLGMTHTLNGVRSIVVFHECLAATLDPASLGPGSVFELAYSEDQSEFNPPFAGAAIGAAPALKQDGVVCVGSSIDFANTTWATRTLTGLAPDDFTTLDRVGHPDFTATGSVISFGYVRSNSNTGATSFDTSHGIYDWAFTTSSLPVGSVVSESKISDTAGGVDVVLGASNDFGECVSDLGDVDGNGVGDLATAVRGDTAAGVVDAGITWILFKGRTSPVFGSRSDDSTRCQAGARAALATGQCSFST